MLLFSLCKLLIKLLWPSIYLFQLMKLLAEILCREMAGGTWQNISNLSASVKIKTGNSQDATSQL